MAKISKKTAKKVGDGLNPTAGTGPLTGKSMDKLFKDVANEPPPLGPIDATEITEKKKKKMKKSIFNS